MLILNAQIKFRENLHTAAKIDLDKDLVGTLQIGGNGYSVLLTVQPCMVDKKGALREKCPNTGLFLVRIFLL